jgi:2-dehydropantoate 2-reductase
MAETIGVLGAGALGTLLATRLARAGHTVHVYARTPARREALSQEGSPLHAEERPEGLRPATLIFFCVKSYDTRTAAQSIAGGGVTSAICSLQNGWGNMENLEAVLPRSPLIAGATSLGAYLDDSGALHASARGTTRFAPWGSTEFRWAEYAATLFESAGLKADASRDAAGILWRKLVLNAAVNPISALSGRPNGAILESGPLLRIAEAAAREAAQVGVRSGYVEGGFDPIPLLKTLLEDTEENRSSMSEDLARGRRTEADAIIGAVVRAGHQIGEPVPVLEGIRALLQAAESTAAEAAPPTKAGRP